MPRSRGRYWPRMWNRISIDASTTPCGSDRCQRLRHALELLAQLRRCAAATETAFAVEHGRLRDLCSGQNQQGTLRCRSTRRSATPSVSLCSAPMTGRRHTGPVCARHAPQRLRRELDAARERLRARRQSRWWMVSISPESMSRCGRMSSSRPVQRHSWTRMTSGAT